MYLSYFVLEQNEPKMYFFFFFLPFSMKTFLTHMDTLLQVQGIAFAFCKGKVPFRTILLSP